jgi:hypothetical protein
MYQYWHFCTFVCFQYGQIPLLVLTINYARTGIGIFAFLVQYQYKQIPLLVMAFNCACTGTGIVAFWFSTSMGMDHYQNWYSVLSVPVLAFWNFGSVPV